jgi:hypothetical protein
MFCWKKSKQQLKYVVYQNIICGFLSQVPTTPLPLPKIMCLRIHLLFPKSSLFGQSQVISSWFKTNKNSKFKLTKFSDQSLSWIPYSSKIMCSSYPLTIIPLALMPNYLMISVWSMVIFSPQTTTRMRPSSMDSQVCKNSSNRFGHGIF